MRSALRLGLLAAVALASTAQADDRAAVYQSVAQRCEGLIQASPEDVANLANLRIPLASMCQCIASTMADKLLGSEADAVRHGDKFPPRVEALWTASRGYCAVTLQPK
jgi:hypothetical protein